MGVFLTTEGSVRKVRKWQCVSHPTAAFQHTVNEHPEIAIEDSDFVATYNKLMSKCNHISCALQLCTTLTAPRCLTLRNVSDLFLNAHLCRSSNTAAEASSGILWHG